MAEMRGITRIAGPARSYRIERTGEIISRRQHDKLVGKPIGGPQAKKNNHLRAFRKQFGKMWLETTGEKISNRDMTKLKDYKQIKADLQAKEPEGWDKRKIRENDEEAAFQTSKKVSGLVKLGYIPSSEYYTRM